MVGMLGSAGSIGWRVSRAGTETLHLELQTERGAETLETACSFWNFKIQPQQNIVSSKATPPQPPENMDSNQGSNIQMSETMEHIYHSNHHILFLENYIIMCIIRYKQDVHKGIN